MTPRKHLTHKRILQVESLLQSAHCTPPFNSTRPNLNTPNNNNNKPNRNTHRERSIFILIHSKHNRVYTQQISRTTKKKHTHTNTHKCFLIILNPRNFYGHVEYISVEMCEKLQIYKPRVRVRFNTILFVFKRSLI